MAVLGIDVGGSGIKGALVDIGEGKFLGERFRLPTPEKAKPDDMAEVVRQIAENFNWQGPVGVGMPGVIIQGQMLTAANLHKSWVGVRPGDLFSKVTGCPVALVNDADAAGLAEMRFGVGRQYQKGVMIFLTLGTGIGSAVFTDGKLVPNTELGHLILQGKDAEKLASDAARQKNELSWGEWAKQLNEYLSYLEFLFWPDVFVLGGGVSKQAEKFVPQLKLRTPVIPAELQNQAGIIGAAMFAYEQFREDKE